MDLLINIFVHFKIWNLSPFLDTFAGEAIAVTLNVIGPLCALMSRKKMWAPREAEGLIPGWEAQGPELPEWGLFLGSGKLAELACQPDLESLVT